MIANSHFPAPGTVVGCEYRWPYDSSHPGCWEKPHKGVVLALDDPRAWKGTLKFPGAELPDQQAVTDHVNKLLQQAELLRDSVPVLWTNTMNGSEFLMWDSKLRPYDEELAAWESERQRKLATYQRTPATVA